MITLLGHIPWRHEDKLLKILGIGGGAYALSWHAQLTGFQISLVVGWIVLHVLVVFFSLSEPILVRRFIRRYPDFEEWRSLSRMPKAKVPELEAALRTTLETEFPKLSRSGIEAALAEIRGRA